MLGKLGSTGSSCYCHTDTIIGVQWDGALYVDAALLFGLQSALKTIADAIEWMVKHEGVNWLDHYLDDFIVLGASDLCECARGLWLLLQVLARTNVPVAPDKQEGPTQKLTFLGIDLELNSR